MTTDVPEPISVACSGTGPGGVSLLGAGTPPVHRIVVVVELVTTDPLGWVADHLPQAGPGVLSIQSTIVTLGHPAQ